MTKILWFSNRGILNSKISGSGSWLFSMSHNLTKHYDVEILNITESTKVRSAVRRVEGNITEWTIPHYRLFNGLPSKNNIKQIVDIVKEYCPDVIHIWGVENYWGLLFSRGFLRNQNTLLEIQGVLFACSEYYRNCLYWKEFYSCQPFLKACYSYFYIYMQSLKFNKRLKFEKEILGSFNNISCQSNWTRHKVGFLASSASFNTSLRPIRPQFISASKWKSDVTSKNIFTIASAEPYKGLHITLKAIAVLKNRMPDVKLLVAGVSFKKINSGYLQYISDLVAHLGIQNNVVFLGSLSAQEIIETIYMSKCMVISSYVESYSAVFAESMYIGIPSVVSFSGAMTEFAKDGESVLYYTPGDYYQCADKIDILINNTSKAETISTNAMLLSGKNDELKVAENQMRIYKDLIAKKR